MSTHYKIYALMLLFFIDWYSIKAQITFNPNSTRPSISISANVSGDDLRTFINANPLSGEVSDRNITFNSELRINNGATLTDNNALYHFPSIFRYAPQSGATVNFTDITIHYTGNAKSHSYNGPYTANFTRVFYLQGITSGRSDFFNNGNYTFNMSDVTLVSYGASDFLHFQTNQTLNNITIVNANGGLNFEPGARLNGEVEIINNLKLTGITRIVGGSGANGDFKTYAMDWDALNWNFSQRNVDFFFVNPIKPNGWIGYSGQASKVKEFYTHDVTVFDTSYIPLPNIKVVLLNDNTNTIDYNLITDSKGQLPTQEILKIDNAVSLNYNRGLSTIIIPEYTKEFTFFTREFNTPIQDNIVINDDTNLTETNPTNVSNYTGININHNLKTITISTDHDLCEVYDYIKWDKTNNIQQPTPKEMMVTPKGVNLDIGEYQFILSGNAKISPCDKFLKITSNQSASIANLNNLAIGLTDNTGTYKIIRLKNIDTASIVITDKTTNTTLASNSLFTGTFDFSTISSSSSVEILVTRDGYSNWSVNLDLSGVKDTFQLVVAQSKANGNASIENQEYQLYLLSKILQKSEGILTTLNGETSFVTVHNITQPATINATVEQQNEITRMLQRILSKVTAARESSKE